METTLIWHDARERRPVEDCSVLVITVTRTNECNCLLEVPYRDGHFNGKKFSLNDDVRYWAVLPEAEEVFDAIKKEDDF